MQAVKTLIIVLLSVVVWMLIQSGVLDAQFFLDPLKFFLFLVTVLLSFLLIYGGVVFVQTLRSEADSTFWDELAQQIMLGQGEAIVARIDEELEKPRSANFKNVLKMFKASGLAYQGAWQKSMDLLDEISAKKLFWIKNDTWQLFYDRLRFNNMLHLDRLAEAEAVFAEAIEPRREKADQDDPDTARMLAYESAQLLFFQGQHEEAIEAFGTLLKHAEQLSPMTQGYCHFYMAQLEQVEQRWPAARRHLNLARELGSDSHLVEDAAALIEEEPRLSGRSAKKPAAPQKNESSSRKSKKNKKRKRS